MVSVQELSHIQHISLLLVPCLHDLYKQDHLALVWMQHLDAFVLTYRGKLLAKCHRCSRRFSGRIATVMCLPFVGRFKRFAAVGGSDGVVEGGSENG